MRKAIAGLLLGAVALGAAVNAVAATALPTAPGKPVAFGQLNNRAVLGLAAAQEKECTPDAAGKGCEPGGEDGGGGGGGNALPIVLGIGAVAGIVGVAAGGGGGGGSNGGSPSSP